MSCHFQLQGIFWTQGSNLCLCLLHGKADPLALAPPEKSLVGHLPQLWKRYHFYSYIYSFLMIRSWDSTRKNAFPWPRNETYQASSHTYSIRNSIVRPQNPFTTFYKILISMKFEKNSLKASVSSRVLKFFKWHWIWSWFFTFLYVLIQTCFLDSVLYSHLGHQSRGSLHLLLTNIIHNDLSLLFHMI